MSGQETSTSAGPLLRSREELVRRWLLLVVERSSLEELAERPLGERIREFELLLKAAGDAGLIDPQLRSRSLEDEVGCRAREFEVSGEPFALALLAGGEGWPAALVEAAADSEAVLGTDDGTTAVVLPGRTGADARAAVDRLRVAAWRWLGSDGRLADVGLATCPEDGVAADELIGAARERLLLLATRAERTVEPAVDGETAVTPLHP
jgi:hypothetical protein